MKSRVHSVGVDLGGTWIRVCAVDQSGRKLRILKTPAPSLKILPKFLQRLWSSWKIDPPVYLTIGSRGMWLLNDRRKLEQTLRRLAENIRVISDVELAFESALTPRNEFPGRAAGILLLAGTGSICVGRNERGQVARAGGLGPIKGDEGSGYWIGQQFLDRTFPKRRARSKSMAEVAALAEKVLKRSRRDELCREIIHEAQGHLAGLVSRVAVKLKSSRHIQISWAGSLMNNNDFRRGVIEKLTINKAFDFETNSPKSDPVYAAAKWAGQLQGFPASFLTKR